MSAEPRQGLRRRIAGSVAILAAALTAGALAAGASGGGNINSDVPGNVKIPDGKGSAKLGTLINSETELTQIYVGVRVKHPQTKDLKLTLRSAQGTVITLSDRDTKGADLGTGTDCDDGDLTYLSSFSNASLSDGEAPYSTTFEPIEPYDDLVGEEVDGTWTLKVRDRKDGNHGRLKCFRLGLYTVAR